jgi:hypothetical protein
MSDFATHMCPACAAGLFEECLNPEYASDEDQIWIIPCAVAFTFKQLSEVPKDKGQAGRPLLDPNQVTDVKSTGRKRAAAIMPFFEGQVCAWAMLKFAGGGVIPILGCQGNVIADVKSTEAARLLGADEVGHRHHGPDKNVLNNTPEVNLHGICTVCHTRWHALNDPFYSPEGRPDKADQPFLPVEAYYFHDRDTTFTDEEYEIAETWWDLKPSERQERFPFEPLVTARKALPLAAASATLDSDENPFPESSPFL